MVGFSMIQDFVTRIQKVDNLKELQQVFSKEIKLLGFDKHTCMSLVDINNPPPNAILRYSFPEKWVERYKQQEYFRDDIVLKSVFSKTGPYSWKELDKTGGRNPQIFSEAKEFGIVNGMTVPLNLPGHYPCSVNMAGENLDINPVNYQILYLLAVNYHHQVIKIMRLDDELFKPPKLSPREKECLIWAAKGLSDHDIGVMLSISSSTVTGYMKSMRAKFKVRTRIQAVAIAVSCGIILP